MSDQPAKTAEAEVPPVPDNPVDSGNSDPGIPLFDASKMGFNDRAWNDPPPLLMTAPPNVVGNAGRPKLTTRVAFPLQSNTMMGQTSSSLNPSGPPPMSGFVHPPPRKDGVLPPPTGTPLNKDLPFTPPTSS